MKNPYKEISKVSPSRKDKKYRSIHREVYHALSKIDLNRSEYKVCLSIINFTWGYNKLCDTISFKQMREYTGLSRRGIINAVKSLEKRRLIIIERKKIKGKEGDIWVNVYMFNKYYDTWIDYPKQLSLGYRGAESCTSAEKCTSEETGKCTSEASCTIPNKVIIKDPSKRGKSHFVPPSSAEEVEKYVQDHNLKVDGRIWYSFYKSTGWKRGDNPIEDWKACVENWHARATEKERKAFKKFQEAQKKTEDKKKNPDGAKCKTCSFFDKCKDKNEEDTYCEWAPSRYEPI